MPVSPAQKLRDRFERPCRPAGNACQQGRAYKRSNVVVRFTFPLRIVGGANRCSGIEPVIACGCRQLEQRGPSDAVHPHDGHARVVVMIGFPVRGIRVLRQPFATEALAGPRPT
jgi:hypothetical protein